MYAKASLSTEEFEAYDSIMAKCDSLTSMPWVKALQSTGATTPVQVRVRRYTPFDSTSNLSEKTIG